MIDINIVTNNIIMRFFNKIDMFKKDLGFNLKGAVKMNAGKGVVDKINIKDTFIKKYSSLNNHTFIRKSGNIGTLGFYEDSRIPQHEFHIYKNETVYEIKITKDELLLDPTNYLIGILKMLEENENIPEEDIVNGEDNENNIINNNIKILKNVTYTNLPETALLTPNMSLPKEQYIESLLKRRKMIEKMK